MIRVTECGTVAYIVDDEPIWTDRQLEAIWWRAEHDFIPMTALVGMSQDEIWSVTRVSYGRAKKIIAGSLWGKIGSTSPRWWRSADFPIS